MHLQVLVAAGCVPTVPKENGRTKIRRLATELLFTSKRWGHFL